MVASNYRGKIPLPLYIKLNNMFPRGPEENEAAWLQRAKHDPLGKQMLRATFEDFQDELQQAVARRTMAMSGARRIGPEAERQLGKKMLETGATALQAGPTLIRQSADRGRLTTTIAQRYRDEFLDANGQYEYATEAYDELLEQFDASNRTPQNGSIFWNGINELALAKLVDEWNTELPDGAKLGQLEATTSPRYVNHQFKWEEGGVFEKYFNGVSDRLGKVRVGTSPQSCGAASAIPPSSRRRNCQRCSREWKTSSRTRRNRASPTSRSPSSKPVHLLTKPVAMFTNTEIAKIKIKVRLINGREDCKIVNNVGTQILSRYTEVKKYWSNPPHRGMGGSEAATRSGTMSLASPSGTKFPTSFNSHWADGEMMASMRDGSGDHWFALLCSAVAFHGLAPEAPIYHHGRYVIGICQ
jgi:hypothetical protein